MTSREKAWKCWVELIEKLEKDCYMLHDKILMKNGCGGDFVDIIEKYI